MWDSQTGGVIFNRLVRNTFIEMVFKPTPKRSRFGLMSNVEEILGRGNGRCKDSEEGA